MSNLDNENTTFETCLMSLRVEDKTYDKDNNEKDSQGLQIIQPGKIGEINGNGPVEPNLQTEISVNTADESMDIPQLSLEQVNTMKQNRAKYRSKVHYMPKDQRALEENEDR